MRETFNVYLDESCHLENDRIPVMMLGVSWCPAEKVREISVRLREIQVEHGLSRDFEIKWTKVGARKLDFYKAVVDYFFDDDDLHFRGVFIPDKGVLDHESFDQTHDEWYYKMCFTLLEPVIDPEQRYAIYLDIKDTRSEEKRKRLEHVLRNAKYDGTQEIIQRVQQIRSEESKILQLADLLMGAVTYANRRLRSSEAKLALIKRIRQRSGLSLERSTWLRASKVNLLHWRSERGGYD